MAIQSSRSDEKGQWLKSHKPQFLDEYEPKPDLLLESLNQMNMIDTISSEKQINPSVTTQQKSDTGCWIAFAIAFAIVLLAILVIAVIILASSMQGYISNHTFFQPASIAYPVLDKSVSDTHLSANINYLLETTSTPTVATSPTTSETLGYTPTPTETPTPLPTNTITPTFSSIFTSTTPPTSTIINPTATTPPFEVAPDKFTISNISGVSMIGIICLLQFFILIAVLKLIRRVNSLLQGTTIEKAESSRSISLTPPFTTKIETTTSPLPEFGLDPMQIKPIKPGYTKCVTRSKTRTEINNQDSGLCGETSHARYIAVADGVGSAKNSKIASSKLVSIFEGGIINQSNTQQIHWLNEPRFIKRFYEVAAMEIGEALIQNKLPPNSAATTFIGIIETENRYLVTYLADGSVYRVMQSTDGEKFVAHSLLRTVNSVTSPDTPEQISATGQSGEPQIITYTQNQRGDLWIIATDGINDFNPDGDKNIQTESIVQKLAEEIWQAFKNNPREFEHVLGMLLERWLKRCQTTDDATLAVLISGDMREHWQKLVGQ